MGEYSLIINDGYLEVQYPDSDRVLFTSSEDVRWDGIIFKDIPGDTLWSLKNLEVRNAEYGIYICPEDGDTTRVKIENCLFDGNCIGIAASAANQVWIKNCEIKNSVKEGSFNGDGVYLLNLPSGADHYVENCEIHDNDGCGLRIASCPSSLKIYNNGLDDNLVQNDSTASTWGGMYFYNSSPKLEANEIEESKGYPLVFMNSGAPYVCKGGDSLNFFELQTGEHDTFAVIYANGSFPVANSAYNNFSHNDANGDYLIRDFTSPSVGRLVRFNWWGVNPPVDSLFYPADSINYDNYLTSERTFTGDRPERGISSGEDEPYDLLDSALIAYYNEEYSQTYQMLVEVIDDYSEVSGAVCLALPHLLNVAPRAQVSLESLYSYLNSIYAGNEGTLVGKTARKVRNDCSVLMGDYTDVISDYQSIIDDPSCLTDSIFALIDANQVYLIMNGLPGILSNATPTALNPVTFEEYLKRETELLALLSSNGNGIASGTALLPEKFTLHQNYPNPFNPTTVIKFDLPYQSKVKLEIFNILGQRVVVLLDGITTAGYRRVVWNGDSDGGVDVASGMYIYRLKLKR